MTRTPCVKHALACAGFLSGTLVQMHSYATVAAHGETAETTHTRTCAAVAKLK